MIKKISQHLKTPILLSACALMAACATTTPTPTDILGSGTSVTATDASKLTHSGFLADYARLKTTSWGNGVQCWRSPAAKIDRYDKIMISRIVTSFVPTKAQSPLIDPADLKTLTDYFHQALLNDLKPQMTVVDKAGAGVLVLRIALTDLVPTTVEESVAGTLIPYGFVAEIGSGAATGRPAGSTPYLGETGIEMQFRDGVSGAVLAECRDTEVGRKYAADVNSSAVGAAQTWASGYLNSFAQWSYAKDAFDKWSQLLAQRIGQLKQGQ